MLQRIVYIYIYISFVHKNIVLYSPVWLHECIRILQVHCPEVTELYFTVKFQNFPLNLSWGKFKIIFFPPFQGNKVNSYVTLHLVFTGVASCMFTAVSAFSTAPVFMIVSSDFSLWEITANVASASDCSSLAVWSWQAFFSTRPRTNMVMYVFWCLINRLALWGAKM